jgi:hypothetical protein
MRLILFFLLFASQIMAQQYYSKNGVVSFFSEAPIENIEAVNTKVSAILDASNGGFAFRLKIEDFVFPNSLMQEHFNESYLESETYPLSTFTGTIDNFADLDLSTEQRITVKGKLQIHGVSQAADILADIEMKNNILYINSSFDIVLDDFNIDIPKIMMYKIAEVIRVVVNMKLQNKNNE